MKQAYVSVVMTMPELPSLASIAELDAVLNAGTRLHEIVVVTPYAPGGRSLETLSTLGPVTHVMTHLRATRDASSAAGLGRAVGDFIIEWKASIESLDPSVLAQVLAQTDEGIELVELTGAGSRGLGTALLAVVNALRPRDVPVRPTVARVYSRNALAQLLAAVAYEPQLDILTAELPVSRCVEASSVLYPAPGSLLQRMGDAWSLLAKGTRFGSAIPLSLAVVSALFGLGAAIYALAFLVFTGRTPEGWTTLMVVVGLGQAAILSMLGLTWMRIDALARGLSRSIDATASTQVVAPRRSDLSDKES